VSSRRRLSVSGWVECSLVDVVGSVTFTVWLSYCNFRCPWCQNSHVVSGEGSKLVDAAELAGMAAACAPFIDYVHVTGGEPTLQAEGLRALLEEVKRAGLKTSLDTNASNPQVVEGLARSGLLDHVAMDVKAPLSDPERYAEAVGLQLDDFLRADYCAKIARSIELSLELVGAVELRVPVVPTLHDERCVARTLRELKEMVDEHGSWEGVSVVLQQFVPSDTVMSERFRSLPRTPIELLHRLATRAVRELGFRAIYVRSLDRGVERFEG